MHVFDVFAQFAIFAVILVMLLLDGSNAEMSNIAVNASSDRFHIKGPFPQGVVITFMGTKNVPFQFNFTVKCDTNGLRYLLKASSDDSSLVNFQNTDVKVDCRNRIMEINPGKYSSGNPVYSDSDQEKNDQMVYFVRGTTTLILTSDMLGRTFITFKLENDNSYQNGASEDVVKVPISIMRKLRLVDHAFQVIIYVFLIFITLAFGAKLDLEVVKENLKRPIAPLIGLLCQFVVMPMIGFGIAKLVTPDRPDIALGIFVAGCCPGGGASNIYSYLLGGDLSLSITMTALSTVLALGMMPMWLYTLGNQITNANVEVPFLRIFTTLVVLIVPLFFGVLLNKKFPNATKKLLKVIKPITVVCIILLLTVGIYSNLYIFKLFRPKIVLAGCLLPYIGYFLGGMIALIFRLPWQRVKTVAIETGMQNVGIAVILMMFAFPPPDGFIAAVAPVASAVMTPLPLFLITIPYLIYRRCNKEKYENVPTENEKETKIPKEMTLAVEQGKISKK